MLIGKAIAEAMKDAKIFPDVEPLVIQRDFPKNDIDPGIYEKVSPVIEVTKNTDLNPHDKIEIPEWAKRQETTPFRADLGPTSTGDKLPNLGTTICHIGEVPSVTYELSSIIDKNANSSTIVMDSSTKDVTINIKDVDQSIE